MCKGEEKSLTLEVHVPLEYKPPCAWPEECFGEGIWGRELASLPSYFSASPLWSAFLQEAPKEQSPILMACCTGPAPKSSNSSPHSNRFPFGWWMRMLSKINRQVLLHLYKSHFPKIYNSQMLLLLKVKCCCQ